jgi:hypothetical protein
LFVVAVMAGLLLGVPAANAAGSWETVTGPTTGILNSVFMVSSSEGWAVGDGGVILHYTGGSWSLYAGSPTTEDLWSVFMVSSSEGWAVGNSGVILHYAAGSWSLQTSPTTDKLYSVHMSSSTDGWAVGDGGVILHYLGQPSPAPTGTPVGGVIEPVNRLSVLAPWLAVIGLVGCISTAVVVAKKRR